MSKKSELSGKCALITGASRGIGEAIAHDMAQQGVRVVLAARDEAALTRIAGEIREAGGEAASIRCDVSRHEDVAAAVRLAVETFGSLDMLVNNAGLIEPISHIATSDPEQWSRIVDVNLKGVYYGMREAGAVMSGGNGGIIVNISSGAATSALEGWSHYCATKAGVLSLTRCGNLEFRERGVRVIGLSPGTVDTEMQGAIRASGINPVSQLKRSDHIPPEWAARAVSWLCTEAAAEFAGDDFSLKSEDNRRLVGLTDGK